MTATAPRPVLVIGVSGSGKSTVGALLAERLNRPFVDSDSLHPPANIEKMATGQPLTDEDRLPWLRIVGERIAKGVDAGEPPVVACSALRRDYRDLVRGYAPNLFLVHLAGDRSLVAERVAARHHEYMPPSLLDSQYAALEPLGADESGVVLDIAAPPAELVDRAAGSITAEEGGRR
ncbi:gluconokinase [Actinoalloteichus spitiensis]|uniref:gluconokinase n=1 Tax=Actinoalloteichus spitiensis TaxID=252394 RepID=UPI0004752F90|nr:gluconokinase [Actinoalloteichus spitiensis]